MLFFAEFKLHPRLQRIFFLQKEWEKQAPGVLQAHHKRAQKITHFYFLENRGPNREHFLRINSNSFTATSLSV